MGKPKKDNNYSQLDLSSEMKYYLLSTKKSHVKLIFHMRLNFFEEELIQVYYSVKAMVLTAHDAFE